MGRINQENPAGLTGSADSFSRISPLNRSGDPTDIRRDKVVNIDHFREIEQNFIEGIHDARASPDAGALFDGNGDVFG
jgi:hypothetical protein